MENRGNTHRNRTGNAVRGGLPALALALLVVLPVTAAVGTGLTGKGGPSVRVSVNGWQ